MGDPGARAHHLDIAGGGPALIAERILVSDRAGPDIGQDFHVAVRVRREARPGGDPVVVPDPDPAPAHPGGVMIAGEGKMVAGVEPAVVGVAERCEGADVDHGRNMGGAARTVKCRKRAAALQQLSTRTSPAA